MRALVLIACLALTGCGNLGYTIKEYGHIGKPITYYAPEMPVRIFDKPEQGKMMITESLGDAARHGFVDGLSLGLAHTTRANAGEMEAAAKSYLDRKPRRYRITGIRQLVPAEWEVTYEPAPR
jgi:hypothetical protein